MKWKMTSNYSPISYKRNCERSTSCQCLADTPTAGCPRAGVFLIIWRLLGDWMVPEMSVTTISWLANWRASRRTGVHAEVRTCMWKSVHACERTDVFLCVWACVPFYVCEWMDLWIDMDNWDAVKPVKSCKTRRKTMRADDKKYFNIRKCWI